MSRSRAWIARLTPAVLTVFLTGGVLPRAVVLVHRHDGAGRPHMHASDADFSPRSRVPIRRHPDRSHGARGPGVWAGGEEGWHAHVQDPFQHAAIPAVVHALGVDSVAPVRPAAGVTAPAATLPLAAARAPPSLS